MSIDFIKCNTTLYQTHYTDELTDGVFIFIGYKVTH